jgi:predicted phosphodiesterase
MVVAAATHVGSLRRWLDTWILNPGSPTLPANGIKSVAVVEIDDDLRPRLVQL